MKLIHESGPNKGREVELRPPFISLGRETDNDVIVDEHEVSRYHAKIEMDGSMWVIRDLESSNGVRLNGQKISDSAPLEHKDELRVGSMVFTILDPNQQTEAAVTEAAPSASSGKPVEPMVTGPTKNEAAKKRIRLMITALFALIVVFVALFLLSAPQSKKEKVDPAAVRKMRYEAANLHLEYKHEKSGFDEDLNDYNLELYAVTIKDHKISARVEKLLEGVSFTKTEELTPEEELELKNAFLALESDEFVNSASLPPKDRTNGFERITLMARVANRGNAVEFVNEEGRIPDAVTKGILKVRGMVERKLEILSLSLKEAFAISREHYMIAKGLSEERLADPKNLWNAIVNANKALVVLKGYKRTPPFYRELQDLYRACTKDHDKIIVDLRKQASVDERTDLTQAKARYQEIVSRIGDPRDPMFLAAREKIFKIDRALRKGGRK
jgi:hypothetical protein